MTARARTPMHVSNVARRAAVERALLRYLPPEDARAAAPVVSPAPASPVSSPTSHAGV